MSNLNEFASKSFREIAEIVVSNPRDKVWTDGQINALVKAHERLVNAARVDELRDMQEYYVADYIDTTAGKNINNYIESRITELEGTKK